MISKILEHARQGTLAQAVLRKLSPGPSGQEYADHYHGDVAKDYLKKRLKQEMWHREQEVVRAILEHYPQGIKVLDVPFGTGRFVEMLIEKDAAIYGIDISQDMLIAAEEALGENWNRCQVKVGSADELPYEDGYFDLAICFRFLGLIPLGTARRVMMELHRTCRGDSIVRVPVRKDTIDPGPPLGEEDLLQGRMSKDELRTFFAEFGFHVKESHQVGEKEKVEFLVFVLGR